MLALSLDLVGDGLGCAAGMLGTCFSGWACLVFAPALAVWKFGWGFSRRTSCFTDSGGDLTYST